MIAKMITGLSAIALITAISAGETQAQDSDEGRYYISGYVGAASQSDQAANRVGSGTGTAPGSIDIDFDLGYAVGGSIGYIWYDDNAFRLRTELDFTYREADVGIGFVDGSRELFGGDNSSGSAIANVLVDFDFGLPVVPYLGGGIGIAGVESDTIYSSSGGDLNNPEFQFGGSTRTRFVYKLIGGLTLPIGKNWEMFGSASYYDAGSVSFDRVVQVTDSIDSTFETDFDYLEVVYGLRLKF